MIRARCFMPALLAAAVLFGSAARGQVLKQVPDDALMVIRFNNIKQTNDKIASLSTKMSLDKTVAALANPLESLKQKLGAANGLNDSGQAAVVVLPTPEGKQRPPALALLPVSDYKAFIANYADAQTDGAVTTLKFPDQDKPMYASHWEGYAAISDDKDLVAEKPRNAGLAMSGEAAREMDNKDILIYANMPAIGKQMQAKLKDRDAAAAEIEHLIRSRGPVNEKYEPLMKALINQALDVADQFIKQSKGGAIGISISDDALSATGMFEFDPASSWGQTVAQTKIGADKLVTGLPNEKYLFVMAAVISPELTNKMIDSLSGPAEQEIAKLGDDGKSMQAYINACKSMLKATKAFSFGWIQPTGQLGQEPIIQTASVIKGDSKQILDAHQQICQSQQAMMDAMGGGAAAGAAPPMKSTYTPNAKTIDGVQLSQFLTTVNATTPQEMQMAQVINMFYGPNGLSAYAGSVAPDKAIACAGLSDDAIKGLIDAARKDLPTEDKMVGVEEVNKHLPKARAAVAYVPLDNIAQTLATYARAFGMPINIQLPENLPPLGVAAATQGSAIRADAYVPADTVGALIAAVMEAKNKMMQGGPGPAPAPAAPAPAPAR